MILLAQPSRRSPESYKQSQAPLCVDKFSFLPASRILKTSFCIFLLEGEDRLAVTEIHSLFLVKLLLVELLSHSHSLFPQVTRPFTTHLYHTLSDQKQYLPPFFPQVQLSASDKLQDYFRAISKKKNHSRYIHLEQDMPIDLRRES